MPVADLPAGLDPDELTAAPGTSARRGKLRRRVAFLRAAREVLLRDLGGFVYELHRTAHDIEADAHRRLRETKLTRLERVDAELHELEYRLDDVRRQVLVREPGVGGECPECGELFGSAAHYCWNCGLPLTESARRAVERAKQPEPLPDPVVAPAPAAAKDQPTQEIPPLDPDHPSAGTDFQWPRREDAKQESWASEPSAVAGETAARRGASAARRARPSGRRAPRAAGRPRPRRRAATSAPARPRPRRPRAAERAGGRRGRARRGRAERTTADEAAPTRPPATAATAAPRERAGRGAGGGERRAEAATADATARRACRRRFAERLGVQPRGAAPVSTMQSPPPDAPVPAGPPERRCPRCGSTLAPDQEWCLACGAAADTEIVEARGWRVPLYLGGALVALAVIGVILAILALANREQEVGPNPTPSAAPPGATPTVPPATGTPSPLPTSTPPPSTEPSPSPEPTIEPEPTIDPNPSPQTGSTFPGWTGADGDYTIIIESNRTQEGAEQVAQQAQDAGETVGVLESDQFSSLNGGYWVVFSGTYTSESDAEADLDSLQETYPDAYVRQIKQ